jgi:uncharacterized membrane protein
MNIENIVLVIAGVLVALEAGLMFCFTVALVPALRAVKASIHIEVFKSINKNIENTVFFLSFFGQIIMLGFAAYLHKDTGQFELILAAFFIQLIFCVGVTAFGNIPLNMELDKVDTEKLSESELEKIRFDFNSRFSKWMLWHHVRTLSSIVATIIIFIACLNK